MRRDEAFARLAARLPGRTSRPRTRRVLARGAAIVLGWLVLMTIWGFGRAWHGGWAPIELVVGLVAGTVATVLAWRRAGRRPSERARPPR